MRSLGFRTRRSVQIGLALVLLVGLGSVVTLPSRGPHCRVQADLASSCGVLWGAALDSRNAALPSTVAATEFATTRRLDIVHTYHRWDDVFPTSAESRLADDKRLLFINWEPVTAKDADLSWGSIARGSADAVIIAEAHRLAAVGRPILISFSHEPELNYRAHGSLADYAAAFRRVVTVSRRAGATNVRWVWDLMGLSDPVWLARYPSLWPGASYVDWIGWDPYNPATCKDRPWQSFDQTVSPFYQWLQGQSFADGKPFMLAEYGTVEGSAPTDKADWFAQVPAALVALPRLKALVYFDYPAPPGNCDWLVTSSSKSTAAFAALGHNDRFRSPAGS